ncbi:Hypothetical protein R9X50_00599300 [Acrodontium crateriforme]|uniref:Kinesin motor domain-containing protein n=1 Tax=Acrodontium crateriforme TaxID=150365 RepID=A0AAQ3RDF6_9PEZI|nr:Hypothetical protein R9X50_00599300 [Acrodontium crateriforme]
MERPASQAENFRPSGLKPPSSRLPAPASSAAGRTLVETSQSDLNARSLPHSGLMAPSIIPSKHKVPGLPEPVAKRKTLAERAAEPINPNRSHLPGKLSISRAAEGGILGSRVPSNGFRPHASQSSISSIGRPQSRGNVLRQTFSNAPIPRLGQPHQDEEEEEADAGVMGKRKGTPTASFLTNLTLRKTRTTGDLRQQKNLQANIDARSQRSGSYMSACNRRDGESLGSDNTSRAPSSSSISSSTEQDPNAQHARIASNTSNTSLNYAFASLSITPPRREPLGQTPITRHRPSLERIKEELSPSKIPKFSCTPALRHAQSTQSLQTPSPSKHNPSKPGLRTNKSKTLQPIFLTKEMLTPLPAWDTKGRLEDMEDMYKQLRSQFASAADSKTALEESISVYKMQRGLPSLSPDESVRIDHCTVQESAQSNRELTATNRNLMSDLDRMRSDLHMTTTDLKQARRDQERDALDAERRYERQLADLISKHENEMQRAERERERATEKLKKEMEDAKRSWQEAKDEESREMINEHWDEMDQAKKNHEEAMAALQSQLDVLRQAGESRATESASEVQSLREKLSSLESQLEASKSTIASLRARIAAEESKCATLEHDKASLISKTHFLEGNQEAQSEEFTTMRKELDEAKKAMNETLDTLRKEEVLRRKLNATILELRGNIRVYTRMRPLLKDEDDPAKVEFPDADSLEGGKEMVVYAPTVVSATGKERNEKHNYSFDRTFAPGTPNNKVFDECRDLIQSVVDGYNVSILSYGQTGSGKTYGMSGPDGIIPSSIGLLLSEMQRVKEKGWEYEVDASFVEVYNETLNDLLGDAKTWDDGSDSSTKGKKKEKHEVHHDPVTGKTSVSNINSISLWPAPEGEGRRLRSSPSKNNASDISESASYIEETVAQLLETSNKNRRVAATKANERSSRSHSIFILTLRGHCDATGDKSEGVLNLVDLAGCERLNESGAEGNRKKETQAINKSLSALGDVIAALGEGKTHIPYRNSKLTYLLQNSLGGTATNGKSSRTLMLLHLSPLQQHYQESKNSLLFGSKVHSTHIGSAKKR